MGLGSMMQKPVKFQNSEKQQLFGIVHTPEPNLRQERKEGVILVHSGASGRIGYGRQYVYYARKLCEEGFHVLRFDPHGMGDSEGCIPGCSWHSFWSNIQTGLYVDDVVASIDFFTSEENLQRITLMGLCAGAVSALLTAGRDTRVDALVFFGMPVLVDDVSVDYQGAIPASDYRSHLMKYVHKAVSFENWKRFLTLKTDYRHIFRLVSGWLKKEFSRSRDRASEVAVESEASSVLARPDFNRYVLSSFMSFANRGKRVLFIYGTNDSQWREFQNEFQARYLSQNGKYRDAYEIYTIEDANHSLAQKKWQDAAIEKSIEWLKENHDKPIS